MIRPLEEIERDLGKLFVELSYAHKAAKTAGDDATANHLFDALLSVNSALCAFIAILRPENIVSVTQVQAQKVAA